jgi:hypothetical protein
MSLHPVPWQRRPRPSAGHEVGLAIMDVDAEQGISRMDEVVVTGAQQHAVVDV